MKNIREKLKVLCESCGSDRMCDDTIHIGEHIQNHCAAARKESLLRDLANDVQQSILKQ